MNKNKQYTMKKKNNHLQKIGTFNCRGLVSSKAKQQMLADDFERYKLAILAIQETYRKGKWKGKCDGYCKKM